MNILTGYLAPTEGEVKVAGFRLPEQAQQAKACVGYLPEQPPLYPEMTVQEYLDFVAELKGVKRAQRKQHVGLAQVRNFDHSKLSFYFRSCFVESGVEPALSGLELL